MASSPSTSRGGAPYVGAAVVMTGSEFVGKNNAVVTFNSVDHDSDGFWDAANHRFVIPAGKGGLYLCGFSLSASMAANAATYLSALLTSSGNLNNLRAYTDYPNLDADDFVGIGASVTGQMAPGDTLTLLLDFHNGLNTTLALEPYACQMYLVRLGDVPA